MTKIAIFPGSFDPFTVGHESIVRRGLTIFDSIIVAVGNNTTKSGLLSIEKRMSLINDTFGDEPRVSVITYHGLTTELCREKNVNFMIRGLRTSADFEFERAIGQINKSMAPEIETVFLLTAPEYSAVSSSIVKEIFTFNGDVTAFMPAKININDYI